MNQIPLPATKCCSPMNPMLCSTTCHFPFKSEVPAILAYINGDHYRLTDDHRHYTTSLQNSSLQIIVQSSMRSIDEINHRGTDNRHNKVILRILLYGSGCIHSTYKLHQFDPDENHQKNHLV